MLSTSAWARGIRARSQALITEGPGAGGTLHRRHRVARQKQDGGPSRTRPPHLRRMAASAAQAGRCPHFPTHGGEHVQVDGRRSIGGRPSESSTLPANGPGSASRPHNSQLQERRGLRLASRANPTLKSPASCSSVRAPSSTTSERSSASSVWPPPRAGAGTRQRQPCPPSEKQTRHLITRSDARSGKFVWRRLAPGAPWGTRQPEACRQPVRPGLASFRRRSRRRQPLFTSFTRRPWDGQP